MKPISLITWAFIIQYVGAGLNEGSEYNKILEEGWLAGDRYLSDLADLERRLIEKDIFVKQGTFAHKMSLFKQPNPEAATISRQATRFLIAAQNISERLNLLSENWNEERGLFRQLVDRQETSICSAAPICRLSKYRTADGSCNNLQRTYLGKSMTPLKRLLPAAYRDRISAPRLAADGSLLPSPRLISTKVSVDRNLPSTRLSLAVMQWGQFLDHDLDSVPIHTLSDGLAISCCNDDGSFRSADATHTQCLPITIPNNDYFFKSYGRVCMNFVRSLLGLRPDCSPGPLDPINELTHWIDGSQVYGSTAEKTRSLRQFSKGLLRVLREDGRDLLPVSSPCPTGDCFLAGDARVKEQPLLALMHTIWVREHNRIATQLARQRPSWNDEKIFQETRRIVAAELQHITYNEWIPALFDSAIRKKYKIKLRQRGYSHDYDPQLSASVLNEFATAGLRMGHSLIQGFIRMFEENGNELQNLSFQLSSTFMNAQALRTNRIWLDSAIRAITQQPIQNFDSSVTTELTNKLFRNSTTPFGFDLVALNIQRGRDHGLQSYVHYLQRFGYPKPNSFNDLHSVMPSTMVSALKTVYSSVNDIDLFAGLLGESHTRDSIFGPVGSNILALQFSLLKRGDRFFYDLGDQPHSFTPEQLDEIRQVRFSRILCDNSDGSVKEIQPWAFLLPHSNTNDKVPCRRLPRMNLRLWANE